MAEAFQACRAASQSISATSNGGRGSQEAADACSSLRQAIRRRHSAVDEGRGSRVVARHIQSAMEGDTPIKTGQNRQCIDNVRDYDREYNRILNSVHHTLDLGPNMLPGAQQYTTVESAAALNIQEKFKGTNDENIHIENGQYRNEWYKRAENMVPQLDGTYNVSDDSDIDLHSYLDLASSNIIAHRTRGQKQRYETDIRAYTSKHLASKESTKPKANFNIKGQKVPDDEDIDINKIAQGNRPKGARNTTQRISKSKSRAKRELKPQMPKQAKGTHY